MSLILTPNIRDPDGFYAELINGQRDLGDDETRRMNARLILLLANHIGDRAVLSEAIRLARSPDGEVPRQGAGGPQLPIAAR